MWFRLIAQPIRDFKNKIFVLEPSDKDSQIFIEVQILLALSIINKTHEDLK